MPEPEDDWIQANQIDLLANLARVKRQLAARTGDTTTIDSTCTIAGKTTTARVVISGSLDSAYTMTMTSEGDAVPGGKSSMTIAATWLGPCTPGQ